MRKSCLNALGTLFRDKELCNDLALFTKRFKKRLISMAVDVDNECSVAAIKESFLYLNSFLKFEIQILMKKYIYFVF